MSEYGVLDSFPGYGVARRYISKQYSYFLQPFSTDIPPYEDSELEDYPLPIDLETVKKYLKMDLLNEADDDFITALISVATRFGEAYTKRDFIIKEYLTYRDNFNDGFFTLRKSLFQELVSFEYLVNTALVPVPNIYYQTNDIDFSSILLLNGNAWPNNIDQRRQAIQIIFTCGYGITEASVPSELRLALLQHIMAMYENRGDCSVSESSCAGALPSTAKLIYDTFRIKDLNTTPY